MKGTNENQVQVMCENPSSLEPSFDSSGLLERFLSRKKTAQKRSLI